MRQRVCAAIIKDETILMVRHQHDGRNYWTLPGGGIEENETHIEALVREVFEETHLQVEVNQFLFKEEESPNRISYCYLATANGSFEAKLGSDPEEADLPKDERMLQEMSWQPIQNMKNDRQVSQVIRYLFMDQI